MLLTASHDGQMVISNPDTAEIIGAVGCEQGDWIRSISWNRAKPDLLAIQYFQHPIQISSIEPIASSAEESTSSHPVQLNVVPAWVGAAPVGASFAIGGKMAVYYKKWDDSTQSWTYNVELKKIPGDPNFCQPMKEMIEACDSQVLTEYCNNRSMEAGSEEEQLIWRFLSLRKDIDNLPDYSEFIQLLGCYSHRPSENLDSSDAANSNSVSTVEAINRRNASLPSHPTHPSTIARTNSSSSTCSDSFEDVFSDQPPIDWNHLDVESWKIVDQLIANDDDSLIVGLLKKKDYASAFVYASHRPKLFKQVLQAYLHENLTVSSRIIAYADSSEGVKNLLSSCPNREWKRKLALLLSRHHNVGKGSQALAKEWIAQNVGLIATFPAIMCGDVDLLLEANQSLKLDTRILQAVALRVALNYSRGISKGNHVYPKVLYEYAQQIVASGELEVAFRLMRGVDTEDEEFCAFRYAIYEALGGFEGTKCKPPTLPALPVEQANLIAALKSDSRYRQTNMGASGGPRGSISYGRSEPFTPPATAPANSRSAFGMPPQGGYPNPNQYQQPISNYGVPSPPMQPAYGQMPAPMTPSVNQIQPPPLSHNQQFSAMNQQFASMPSPSSNGYMQPSPALPSQPPLNTAPPPTRNSTSGWNDPPPVQRKTDSPKPTNVMQIQWNPGSMQPQQPSYQHPGIASSNLYNQQPTVAVPSSVQPSPSAFDAASTASLSPAPLAAAIPQVQLSAEDQPIIDKLNEVLAAIQAANPQPATLTKVGDIQRRIATELSPRLAVGKLSLQTRQFLYQFADLLTRGEFRAAQMVTGQMVRVGGDFVEVSSFLPALKSCCSVGMQVFGAR
ncbi:hypothetical protein WR25_09039 [Diploscapter pachys]|uniref:Ancestral coatomer element 1 Sec16/Sec31 domain-containing protein n=1 Tax=Diploscapter pachys TaxID=2018661 RepID=A0A2A2K6D5_9BILA|nr:hypothetical protein WR25_09039 [Diploscapter pachys]